MKIRLQLLHQALTGVQTASNLIRKEGVAALWKGNVPAEILYILYGALQFTTYSALNKGLCKIQEEHGISVSPLAHLLLVGSGSGLVSTFVTYPFDVLRTKLVSNESKQFLSMSDTSKKIWQDHGLRGFFAGIRPSAVSIMVFSGLFFWSYSLAREASQAINNSGYQVWGVEAICGFLAGATAKGVTFPLDTLRKRMQVVHHKSAIGMFADHWRKHGLSGFYRGFAVSLVKTAPTSALSIAIYEYSIAATRRVAKCL